jgi:hypothetical protein
MGNITTKTDLLKLKGAVIMPVGKNQTECIVIPIEMASLYKGANAVYFETTSIPLKELKPDRKDTHLVKQSFSKEKFAAMSEEEKKVIPILGNAIVWGENSNNNSSSTPAAPTAAPDWL